MKDNGCLIIFLCIICLLGGVTSFMQSKLIDRLEEQNKDLKTKYNTVCGSLNDCCRNTIDTYNLSDSIYNSYLDIIEEQGYNKQEVKHLYFSY